MNGAVSKVHGASFLNRALHCTLHCNHRPGHLKTEHTESLFLLQRHLGNWPRGPAVSTSERTTGSAWETWTVAAADGVGFALVRWEINFLLTLETASFFCVYPVYIATARAAFEMVTCLLKCLWQTDSNSLCLWLPLKCPDVCGVTYSNM